MSIDPPIGAGDFMLTPKQSRVLRRKRVIDLGLVVLSAPVTVPVIVATALVIRVLDGRPIIFKQTRLGLNEVEFDIFKFRTMCVAAEHAPDHDRLTRVGRWLRKLSIDELPQLLNVLRGDMSLVGPRPLYPNYGPFYTEREQSRHLVRPGITGLAQTSGRNSVRWSGRLALDVQYVQNLSLRQDFRIFWRTLMGLLPNGDVSVLARDTGEPLNVERSYPSLGGYSIRRFNALDIDTRVAWMMSPKTSRYMNLPALIDRKSTLEWYASAKIDPWRDDFVVYDQRSENIVCMLGLKSSSNSSTGVLYIFTDPEGHGRGYGRTAVKLLLEWAERSRYDRIRLSVDARNVPAVRLYESLGFRVSRAGAERTEYSLDLS